MKLSFVVPCYRSEKTIRHVCDEVIEVVEQRPEYDYEIITVNDASPDNVFDVLCQMAGENKKIKVIDCAKNMGKHAALMAGFKYCTGDYIICMDDDSQCPIDQLWKLIQPLSDGYDVSMAQYGKKAQSGFKNIGSRMNAWMMTSMIDKPKEFQFANFAAMRAFVVAEIIKYDNPYTYVNGLILRTTKNLINVPMKERKRMQGIGGYTFFKSLKLWFNGYTAFSVVPLRLATLVGAIVAGCGFLSVLYIIIRKILNPEVLAGYTSTLAAILFVGGVIMLMMGMLGEYVGRIYMCINNSPQYVIRDTLNIEDEKKTI